MAEGDKFTLKKCTKNDFEEEEMHDVHASAIWSLMYAHVYTYLDICAHNKNIGKVFE